MDAERAEIVRVAISTNLICVDLISYSVAAKLESGQCDRVRPIYVGQGELTGEAASVVDAAFPVCQASRGIVLQAEGWAVSWSFRFNIRLIELCSRHTGFVKEEFEINFAVIGISVVAKDLIGVVSRREWDGDLSRSGRSLGSRVPGIEKPIRTFQEQQRTIRRGGIVGRSPKDLPSLIEDTSAVVSNNTGERSRSGGVQRKKSQAG